MDAFPAGLTEPARLVITGTLLMGASGLPGLFLKKSPTEGQLCAALLVVLGSLMGLFGALATILTEQTATYTLASTLPFGPCAIGIDPLSAFFLIPVCIVAACCAVYGTGYWPAAQHPRTAPRLSFFFGLLAASLALLPLARDGVLFLVFWEVMALAAFFALATEDWNREVRDAAKIYLVVTHIGTLALFATFSLLRTGGDSFAFPGAATLDGTGPLATAIFLTALFGCGMKAGMMPLHIWLPGAHASAPSHVSAIMSGIIIKMGIYGLVRILSFYDTVPAWWGIVLLAAGIVSSILGVAFAVGQHDLKRLLAYHSIENIGIIVMGIGVALIGRAIDMPGLVLLGMAGALLHVLNHALFKSLLFLGAGAVIHDAGTREIDRLGGLGRRMPWTAALFLTGAVAICGLPPLNGFVSEYLIYLGFFSGVVSGKGAAVPLLGLAAPALAMVGGLAVLCFVKVFGTVFLGLPRTTEAAACHEPGWAMRGPMVFLAILCAMIGLAPVALPRFLEPALFTWNPQLAFAGEGLADAAPLGWVTILGALLVLMALGIGIVIRQRLQAAPRGTTGTWDCGFARPTTRMQYTASSFAEMLVKLFAGVLRPKSHQPEVRSLFPVGGTFASHVPEAVLELVITPLLTAADRRLSLARRLQHGQLHLYILYIFVTLAILLAWAY
ncbi:MAG: hydrogenase [Desulfuromonadales bacterium]|nr:MAG: hydrogenase [Desulfuromonadales bacterium]